MNIDKLIKDILQLLKDQKLSQQDGVRLLQHVREYKAAEPQLSMAQPAALTSQEAIPEPIAIVGMSGRFPGAQDMSAFWQNLQQGVDSVAEIPADRWSVTDMYDADIDAPDKSYCKYGGFIQDVDAFDAAFFNISPREAELMDPQQRLFLQQAWHALENAGYAPESLAKKACGVFVGTWAGDYLAKLKQHRVSADAYTFMGNAASILPARIAYLLNLRGPAMAIDTACSSSLVSIHLACESIRNAECDMALAGGVTLLMTSDFHVMASKAEMLSAEGHCYTFDHRANGMVPGEGVGVVVLKSLTAAIRDQDHIHAVIKGSGINQDGKTNGITAPSAPSQSALEKAVYNRHQINPAEISYVEAHGTGTPLGDPIEVQALSSVFREYTQDQQYCALGSVKTNIGHTLGAAGIASVLKTLLCLQHQQLPPSLHYEQANAHLALEDSPFYVNTQLQEWETKTDQSRQAAISSFGFSGTNAHLVLEEYQHPQPVKQVTPDSGYLFVLSARSEERLDQYVQLMHDFVRQQQRQLNLRNMMYTLQVGREAMQERLAISVSSLADLAAKLSAYLQGEQSDTTMHRGNVRHMKGVSSQLVAGRAGEAFMQILLEDGEWEKLAELWVSGITIDWQLLYRDAPAQRMPVPVYPFAERAFPCPYGDSHITTSVAPTVPQVLNPKGVTPSTVTAVPDGVERESIILHTLQNISAKLLKIPFDDMDVEQPLLEMGADSIIIAQIVRNVETTFAQNISIRQFFEELNTLKALSRYLDAQLPADYPLEHDASMATTAQPAAPTDNTLATPQTEKASPKTTVQKTQAASVLPGFQSRETQQTHLSDTQQTHLQALIDSHTQRTAASKRLTQAFRPILADSRASAGFRFTTKEMLYPLIGETAKGAKIVDIDGNEYIDITMGFGVNLLGHQPDFITQAMREQLDKSIQLGPQTALAGDVAQLICELTGLQRVTFCNSGTEAVMTALRLARTKTGRKQVVQFGMSYHGHFDGTLGDPTDGLDNPQGIPMAPGIAPNMVKDSIILEYGNLASLDIVRQRLPELAAVLVEPVQSRRPGLQPREFLHQLRQLTREAGVPLIIDEMITGFRIHPGGAQAWFGIDADIATYGKIVGGGMPIGVVAGKREYMDGIDGGTWQYGDRSFPQEEATFFAGTFCKHPLAMAAAKAILTEIKRLGPALQEDLNAKTTALSNTLNAFFEAAEAPLRIAHFGSLFRFEFQSNMDLLFYHLLEHGVYIWEGRNCFISSAHTDADIRDIIQAIKDSVRAMQRGGFMAGKVVEDADLPTEPAHDTEPTEFGLTEAQNQLWVLTQLSDQGSLAYHESVGLTLQGDVQHNKLQQAVTFVINQHQACLLYTSPSPRD